MTMATNPQPRSHVPMIQGVSMTTDNGDQQILAYNPPNPHIAEQSHPPQDEQGPPPYSFQAKKTWNELPTGWEIAFHPADGRMYYVENETGRTSWSHPFSGRGPDPVPRYARQSDRSGAGTLGDRWRRWRGSRQSDAINQYSYQESMLESPNAASRYPDSHQCCAVFSCLVMPPLGLCALFHSSKVNRAWNEGRYIDAIDHSRQAYNYAWYGVALAICIVLYFWITNNDFDFNFDEWLDFN
eukprot:CAMPEP_0183299228 /NCGR_PEP_ID=MMETSP0160_2-20130417/6017_1 /TAXON_ID=2839 ORGANISM="Odontella Sinensis, Strain Grunow 1884" /NCGR_SAMPLE_ID=MMETSP0160_2 /ASSEMBLY_ACC=CAM_ASM_000250 /LENGTH=240 /DNA_ID=CAMNT_0025461429 /DNA_START=65 /DNA_END=787 /DNA_ORIENTATION=-